jgi:hypothetical protein
MLKIFRFKNLSSSLESNHLRFEVFNPKCCSKVEVIKKSYASSVLTLTKSCKCDGLVIHSETITTNAQVKNGVRITTVTTNETM